MPANRLTITTVRDPRVAAALANGGRMECPDPDCFGSGTHVNGVWNLPGEHFTKDCPACNGRGHVTVIYIGRAMPWQRLKGSPLGNPYKVDSVVTAPKALVYFDEWLRNVLEDPCKAFDPVRDALNQITALLDAGEHVALGCWCHGPRAPVWPPQCHGDVVAKIIGERQCSK